MNVRWENIKRKYLQAGGLLLARRSQRLRRTLCRSFLADYEEQGKYIYKGGEYSVIQGTVAPSVNIGTYWYPSVDIGSYVFPGNVLPYITPIFP